MCAKSSYWLVSNSGLKVHGMCLNMVTISQGCVFVMAGGVLRTFDSLASSFYTPHCLTFDLGLLELSIKGPF